MKLIPKVSVAFKGEGSLEEIEFILIKMVGMMFRLI